LSCDENSNSRDKLSSSQQISRDIKEVGSISSVTLQGIHSTQTGAVELVSLGKYSCHIAVCEMKLYQNVCVTILMGLGNALFKGCNLTQTDCYILTIICSLVVAIVSTASRNKHDNVATCKDYSI
jgi:hypothetical protein